MSIDDIYTLVTNTPVEDLPQCIATHGWTIETIQSLKDFSSQFYFSDSAQALAIAQSTFELSRLLSFPAPLLGEWTLANALLHHAFNRQAVTHFQNAYLGYRNAGLLLDAARLSVGYVFALVNSGEAQAALQLGRESESYLAEAGKTNVVDQNRLAGLLLNLGGAYERLGMYEEAVEVGRRLEPLALALDHRLLLAQTQHNQAYDLVQIGAFEQAIQLYQLAEKRFLAENAVEDLIRLYVNFSNLYALLEQYRRALPLLISAEKLLETLAQDSQSLHRLALVRAQLLLLTGDNFEESLFQRLAAAQSSFEENGPVVEASLSLILQGRGYLHAGVLANAEASFHRAMTIRGVEDDKGIQFRAFHGLGQVAQRSKKMDDAIQYHRQAIGCIDAIRHTLHVESYRAAFMTDKLSVYQDLTEILLAKGEYDSAFSVVEQGKSRVIAEKLAWRLSAETSAATHSSDDETRTLAQQLHAAIAQLDALHRNILQNQSEKNEMIGSLRLENMSEASKLESEIQHLLHRLQRHNPHFSTATLGQKIDLQDFAPHLQDSIFLQYHRIADFYFVFVVDRTGIQFHLKLAGVKEIETKFNQFMGSIERMLGLITKLGVAKVAKYQDSLLADVNQHLSMLHSLLLAPILELLPNATSLIISPQGLLHYLPFHAFYDGTHYLIEERRVSYSPSATILDFCYRQKTTNQEILLCGHDDGRLRSVVAELQQTAHLLAAHHPQVDTNITTNHLLAQMPNKRLLHIAAHSSFRSDNPMLSSFSLADRRLTLAEIVQLHLDADLVILSSCETGKGQLQGDEVMSLASGFLGAGTRSLILSLWRVEDEATAQFMKAFYTALTCGESCAKALQTAQLELLNHGRNATDLTGLYRHPAFWAPFIVLGNPNTQIGQQSL